MIDTPELTVYQGDAQTVLAHLPPESVHCIVTSPPYWNLRDYGVAGQIGLEATPGEYVDHVVEVFTELRRVLRRDGTCWLNMGDSWANRVHGKSQTAGSWDLHVGRGPRPRPRRTAVAGLKVKDLVGMPWQIAFALRDSGWYLRSDIIWSKPNPLPESVVDRPTRSHEYLFLLTRSRRYYYDGEAIREPLAEATMARLQQTTFDEQTGGPKDYANDAYGRFVGSSGRNRSARRTLVNLRERAAPPQLEDDPARYPVAGRNVRSVWEIATQPYPEAHFATFPEELPRRAILAGSPAAWCRECGKPRVRVVKREGGTIGTSYHDHEQDGVRGQRMSNRSGKGEREGRLPGWRELEPYRRSTDGFTDCGHGAYAPGVVLDPFAGSGTALMVANELGRRAIGIELRAEYVRQIAERCDAVTLAAWNAGAPIKDETKLEGPLWQSAT